MIQRTKQGTPGPASRRTFGVFVLCWLNLAMMPCAMAFELADDCPNCPPAAEQEMAHHGHHDATVTPDCETAQPDCCDLAPTVLDNRGSKFESQDDAQAIATLVSWPSLQTLSISPREMPPPDPGNSSPSLHKLFCVYLD